MTKKIGTTTNKLMSRFRIENLPFELSIEKAIRAHTDGIWEINVSPVEGVLGTASADQTAKIWSPDSASPLCIYAAHSGSVNTIAFHASEATVCTGSGDTTAHIWRLPAKCLGKKTREDPDVSQPSSCFGRCFSRI